MNREERGRRWVLLVAFSFFHPWAAEAQTQPAPSSFGETVEVRRGTIDVVVTAKNGQHVTGLDAGAFELLVDGKPQPITGFEEIDLRRALAADAPPNAATPSVAAPTTSEPERRRNIILLLDSYSLDGQRRNQAIAALRRFLASNWSRGDQAMVAVWNRELHVPQTFTNDLGAVERSLDEATKLSEGGLGKDRRIVEMRVRFEIQKAQMATGRAQTREIQDAYTNSLSSASFYADEQFKRSKTFVTDVEELMRGVAGVPGKKVLVLVGENLPQFAGLGVFEYVNELFNPYARLIRIEFAQTLASHRNLSQAFQRLTRTANAHGVSVHTIFSGETPSETPTEQENSTSTIAQFAEFTNTAGSFGTLSRETGGIATLGSRNFDLATSRIAGDLGHYYTLVWRIASGDRKARNIDVRTKDRSLVVRARRELVPKTVDEEIEDRVVSSLYQPSAPNSPEISVQAGKPSRRAGSERRSLSK